MTSNVRETSIQTSWWTALFGALLVLSLLVAGACFGVLPPALSSGAAALLFFGTGAPILRRMAPAEPALLKAILFACLLSPVFTLAIWLVARAVLPAGAGGPFGIPMGGAYLAIGGLQLWGIWGECRRTASNACSRKAPPAGPAAHAALFLSISFALVVAFALLGEASIRASFHGLLHASIVEATAGGVPPENPWLAGGTLQYYWVWHALGSLIAGSLRVAPTDRKSVV